MSFPLGKPDVLPTRSAEVRVWLFGMSCVAAPAYAHWLYLTRDGSERGAALTQVMSRRTGMARAAGLFGSP